jgi:hypothetical protein
MRKDLRLSLTALGTVLFILSASAPAEARPIEIDEGRWRLELQGAAAVHSSKTDREGDYYVTGSAEYEMPTRLDGLNFGLRMYPLFAYRAEEDDIYGVAAGITFRFYQNADTRDGLYAEAGTGPVWLSHHLEGNSTRVNFLNELGVGYKFPDNPWSVSLKYQHISNASTGNDNAGVNAFSLGVGYTF